jgi:hypothetical protein
MSEEFKASADFVDRVMRQVRAYERQRLPIYERIFWSRPVRYALAGGGTIFGILKAAPVF